MIMFSAQWSVDKTSGSIFGKTGQKTSGLKNEIILLEIVLLLNEKVRFSLLNTT